MNKWDERFLTMAALVATWSKDPSTGVGAVITDGKRVVSVGFNGLASGVADVASRLEDREVKLKLTIHAEVNAILFANVSLKGCTIYTTHFPCSQCTSKLIQTGISRVVTATPESDFAERWASDISLSKELMKEVGIEFLLI